MRVALVNTLYEPNVVGGAERSVQFLAEALVGAGHAACVICTAKEPGVLRRNINGVEVWYVGLKNLYWHLDQRPRSGLSKALFHVADSYNPFMARKAGEIFDQWKPDLVHTNNLMGFSTALWREAKRRGLPIVHTLRDYYLLCPRTSMFDGGRNCEKQCVTCRLLSLPRIKGSADVDVVVGNSEFILKKHLSLGGFERTRHRRVIYNAFKAPTDLPVATSKAGLRIGYIGRLDETKGVKHVLNAIKSLPADSYSLTIAGIGPEDYVAELMERSKGHNVRFLGYMKPENFYPEIDLLVVPSIWHEPLPRTIFESYSFGVPVIGSNRGGILEIVEPGKTGFLFDPDSVESLTKIFREVLDNPASVLKMKAACREYARRFEPDRIVGEYLLAYREAMSNRG